MMSTQQQLKHEIGECGRHIYRIEITNYHLQLDVDRIRDEIKQRGEIPLRPSPTPPQLTSSLMLLQERYQVQ
jgi:hypothetical protein